MTKKTTGWNKAGEPGHSMPATHPWKRFQALGKKTEENSKRSGYGKKKP